MVSKGVAWSYGGLAVFIAALIVFFAYAGFFTPMGGLGIAASLVSAIVEIVMILILRSIYRTRYVLTDEELVIKTTRLIGGEKRVPLKTVESVEKVLIPFGIRLFGASFHGGYYLIPGLGRAFLAITNFQDELLIKTREGNYIITPKDPEGFREAIEVKGCP
ncbi:MAG: PH domain-containing protein [Candidatus Bathyarchaeia archaeon]